MEEPIWAVYLYEGVNGDDMIEFVRASSADEARAAAENLNDLEGAEWEAQCAAQVPDEVS